MLRKRAVYSMNLPPFFRCASLTWLAANKLGPQQGGRTENKSLACGQGLSRARLAVSQFCV